MPSPPTVPIPSNPTNPAGGSGSASTYYNLLTNYINGAPLQASDLDKLINLIDNLVSTSLAGLGAGTLVGGQFSAATGLNVPVSAWRGILPQSSARVGYAGGIVQATTLTIPANSTFWVWAVPVSGTYPDGNTYDTAESAIAQFEIVTDGSTPNGGTPLFSGTSTASAVSGLTDQRISVGLTQIQSSLLALQTKEASDVSAIETAIGNAYFPTSGTTTPNSVDSRLSALEQSTGSTSGSGGGTSGGTTTVGPTYWGALKRTATDTTTIPAYVQSQLPTPTTAPTPADLTDDVVVVNLLKDALDVLNYNGAARVGRHLDCLLCVPGITSNSLIDLTHTTAPVDSVNHTFG